MTFGCELETSPICAGPDLVAKCNDDLGNVALAMFESDADCHVDAPEGVHSCAAAHRFGPARRKSSTEDHADSLADGGVHPHCPEGPEGEGSVGVSFETTVCANVIVSDQR